MLVVSSVIGVGIFLTPGMIADTLPYPGLLLAAWIVGGLISTAGALANAELGTMYPHAGGDYVYLREAYHPAAGFLVGWLSFFVIFSGTVAALAIGFADGLSHFVPLGSVERIGTAIALIAAVSGVNYLGVRLGARLNNLTAAAKIAALLGLAIIGPLFGTGDLNNLRPLLPNVTAVPISVFGLALSPVLFSYLGWNACVYVASEIRDPGRTIPRSLFTGLAICTVLYLMINAAYLYALPIDRMRGNVHVAETAAHVFFGRAGGGFAAALVLIAVASSLNATILLGPRIAYAMTLDRLFFGGVDRVHSTHHTPHIAIIVQAITAICLVLLLQSFPRVLDYTIFAIIVATMADTTALYALRWRQPNRSRPYRAWGYPVVPALYLAANAGIAASMLWGRPAECGIALAIAATGLPFYAAFAWRRRHPPTHSPE